MFWHSEPVSAADLINRLLQAKVHLDRARELIRAAGTELHQARTLVHAALQGASNQSAVAMVDRTAQQLEGASVGVERSTGKVEEVLARVRGLGGLGN
jgi:hypothetical protein